MAVKFSYQNYWNPTEWVSRTLFRGINDIPNSEITQDELFIVEQVREKIKLYVWLLNCERYKDKEFVLLNSLIDKSRNFSQVKDEYNHAYDNQIKQLKLLIKERLKRKSS